MNVDVAIIGASLAGLHAAEQLARAGRRVALFEKHGTLEPARRTLIITPQLHTVLGYSPTPAILHRIAHMAVATPRASAQVTLAEPDLIVERGALTQIAAARAQAAGAQLYFAHRFQKLEPARDGLAVQLRAHARDDLTIHARALIGADGVFSTVAQAAGIKRPPFVPIVQAEVALPADWDPSVTKVWFDASETRYFYWLIPESAERAVVGLVADSWTEARHLLQRFLNKLGLQPLAHQASWVAMHQPSLQPWTRIGAARVLLVGDAAGHVKVSTVGGSVSGVWGAQAAAQALLRGSSYARELRALKLELDVHYWVRALLERMDNAAFDELVSLLSPRVLRFLSEHNRDAMAGALWTLPLLQPALLKLGVRLLLRRDERVRREAPLPAEAES